MDSIIGDFFQNGRRLRAATEEYAVSAFPRLILRLKQGRLIVSVQQTVGNPDVVASYNPSCRFESWVILKTDFDICIKILDKFVLNAFRSDNESIVLDKIRAYVKFEFAGIGVPSNVT